MSGVPQVTEKEGIDWLDVQIGHYRPHALAVQFPDASSQEVCLLDVIFAKTASDRPAHVHFDRKKLSPRADPFEVIEHLLFRSIAGFDGAPSGLQTVLEKIFEGDALLEERPEEDLDVLAAIGGDVLAHALIHLHGAHG